MSAEFLSSTAGWLAFTLPFLCALALMPLARRLALYAGLVDMPGGRKQHEGAIPLVGGLVIFGVYFLASLSLAEFFGIGTIAPVTLIATLCLLILVGALDDYYHVNAWPKFFVQIAVATTIVLWGEVQLFNLGNLFGFGDVGLDVFSLPFTILAVVLCVNAINLVDGLDGLAGGIGAIIPLWLILAASAAGQSEIVLPLLGISGALAGFLWYNMRHPFRAKACVFLGDAGSMALGLVIAWYAISLSQEPLKAISPIAVAWILSVPIMDSCAQFVRRIVQGKHPFAPDRGHFHHLLLDAGLTVPRATGTIWLLTATTGAIGYFGQDHVPSAMLTTGWLALFAVHTGIVMRPQLLRARQSG